MKSIFSETSSALSNKAPKFKKTTLDSLSFTTLALPISTASRSELTDAFGPVPLGYLTAAGPLCLKAVVKSNLVSFSSEGVIRIIFGIHLR